MKLLKFQKSLVGENQELIVLRRRFGGTIGELSLDNEKLEVLKLGEGLYASDKKPSKAMSTVAELEQTDIHPILSGSDAAFFAHSYKTLEVADGKA